MNQHDPPFTPVSTLGEFGLIERIKLKLGAPSESVVVGVGDDAAAIAGAGDRLTLVSTDALIEHVHFDRTYSPMRHLGYKAIAVNVSDIAAMNGLPQSATVSIGLPNSVSVEHVDQLYAGMTEAAEQFGLDIVGGDTTGAHHLVLSVTVLGECGRDQVVLRSGASAGDILFVSGPLGTSYAGLRILQHHKQRMVEEGMSEQPDLSTYSTAIERHLRGAARIDLVNELASSGVKPTAMLDLSDGLASDVRHIAQASNCGVEIDLESLPVTPDSHLVADLLQESVEQYALRGGEDYELLFTVAADAESATERIPGTTRVGTITEAEAGLRVVRDGMLEPLPTSSYTHF